MNQPDRSQQHLSDEQLDDILSEFFASEMPEELQTGTPVMRQVSTHDWRSRNPLGSSRISIVVLLAGLCCAMAVAFFWDDGTLPATSDSATQNFSSPRERGTPSVHNVIEESAARSTDGVLAVDQPIVIPVEERSALKFVMDVENPDNKPKTSVEVMIPEVEVQLHPQENNKQRSDPK